MVEAMQGQLSDKDAEMATAKEQLALKEQELMQLREDFDSQTAKLKQEIDQQLPKLAAAATARAQQEWQRRCEDQASTLRGAMDEEMVVQRQRDAHHSTQVVMVCDCLRWVMISDCKYC